MLCFLKKKRKLVGKISKVQEKVLQKIKITSFSKISVIKNNFSALKISQGFFLPKRYEHTYTHTHLF